MRTTLFPADSDFIVSPNYIPSNNDSSADFVVSFEISRRQHPVLILEVKPPQHLLLNSTQKAADRQIRRRLVDLSGRAHLPVLCGISAIGTRLCFYKFEKALRRMTPRHIPSDPEFTTDVAPQEQWDCDVLEDGGEQQLRALTTQVMEACERLQDDED